jgi:hypothetical protein
MGLLSSLFGGGSSNSSATTSTSNISNTELAGGNIGGPATYGTGNTVISTTTDQGTVQAATDISNAALALGYAEAQDGSAVAIAGLAHAGDAYTSSLALVGDVTTMALNNSAAAADGIGQFAGKALDSVSKFSSSALDDNTYIAGKSLDSTAAAYSASLSTLASTNAQALSTVQNGFTGALDQVNALAQQVSQSATQTTDDTVQKIVLYIALAAGIFFLSKSRG